MHKHFAKRTGNKGGRHFEKRVYFGRRHRVSEIIGMIVMVAAIAVSINLPAIAEQVGVLRFVKVTGYDANTDYSSLMDKVLNDGSEFAMEMGRIFEQQRNLKIRDMHLNYPETDYFSTHTTAAGVRKAKKRAEAVVPYTDEDLELFAHLIYAEAGASWIPDWVQIEVGSVVINRMNDPDYPDTLHDVIYQPGQYSPTWDGSLNKTPDERTYANAEWLLQHGSQSPAGVVGQAGFVSGPIYKTYYDDILGPEYFCYKN